MVVRERKHDAVGNVQRGEVFHHDRMDRLTTMWYDVEDPNAFASADPVEGTDPYDHLTTWNLGKVYGMSVMGRGTSLTITIPVLLLAAGLAGVCHGGGGVERLAVDSGRCVLPDDEAVAVSALAHHILGPDGVLEVEQPFQIAIGGFACQPDGELWHWLQDISFPNAQALLVHTATLEPEGPDEAWLARVADALRPRVPMRITTDRFRPQRIVVQVSRPVFAPGGASALIALRTLPHGHEDATYYACVLEDGEWVVVDRLLPFWTE